jgi:hypothetical protein
MSRKTKVKMSLVRVDGNAKAVMEEFRKCAKEQGWVNNDIESVLVEARKGNYDHLLNTIIENTEEEYEEECDIEDWCCYCNPLDECTCNEKLKSKA